MTPTAAGPGLVRFDCYEVDLAAGRLFKGGSRIRLREQSFQVLAMLLERPGEVVTREDLRRRLWPTDVFVDFENSLNAAVARLREALGDSAERPRFIETLPKRGYRFIGTASEFDRQVETLAAGRARSIRLLVLPFVNSSGDPGQEYFSDAVTDELITDLAGYAPDRLAVLARTTAMHYKGGRKNAAEIGRELGVDYIVEGSARRAEERVQLTVQLIRTRDQAHVFAKRYDAPMGDLFATKSAVAHAVAEHLQVRLAADVGPAGAERPRRPPTPDLAAYNSYIQGRYHLHRFSPDAVATAKQLFEDAVRRDPRFALAYDALADLYWSLGFTGLAAPRDVASSGLFYALRAVEIDNTLAETRALVAQYRLRVDFDWPEVEREMRAALELNPASPIVRLRYAVSGLMPQGRLEAAIAEIRRALELDPLDSWTRSWLVVMLWLARRADLAIDESRRAIDLDPTFVNHHMQLGVALCQAGRFDEAVAALREAESMTLAPLPKGWLGLALALGGQEEEARRLLDGSHAMAGRGYVPPTAFAWIHLGLGETDEAFVWMDKAIDARDAMMTPIKSYWFFDPIRTDPRFHGLLRKMKLDG